MVLEFFTIIVAFVLEGYQMTFGSTKPISDWITQKNKETVDRETEGIVVKPLVEYIALRLVVAIIIWTGSVLYIIYSFIWLFSSDIPIRAAGIVLMVLSAIALFWFKLPKREKPLWYNQLDSMLSMVSLGVVALVRIRGGF